MDYHFNGNDKVVKTVFLANRKSVGSRYEVFIYEGADDF